MTNLMKSKFFVPILAIFLIGAGIAFSARYIQGAANSYTAMRFATEHNFDEGNVDEALVQPWMNLRYIAEAYAVPQIYLFEELDIPMDKRASRLPIGRINRRFQFGETDGEPAVVEMVRNTIRAYRDNPVVTGLAERRVEPWMNMQYIANSTGIPVDTFFAAAEIPSSGNEYKPLDWLVDSTEYDPGLDRLLRTLQDVVESNDGKSNGSQDDDRQGNGQRGNGQQDDGQRDDNAERDNEKSDPDKEGDKEGNTRKNGSKEKHSEPNLESERG